MLSGHKCSAKFWKNQGFLGEKVKSGENAYLIIEEIGNILQKHFLSMRISFTVIWIYGVYSRVEYPNQQRSLILYYSSVYSSIWEGVITMLHTVLWGIVIVILVLWLLGFLFRIAGGIIRILIAVAAVIIIINIITYILGFWSSR